MFETEKRKNKSCLLFIFLEPEGRLDFQRKTKKIWVLKINPHTQNVFLELLYITTTIASYLSVI